MCWKYHLAFFLLLEWFGGSGTGTSTYLSPDVFGRCHGWWAAGWSIILMVAMAEDGVEAPGNRWTCRFDSIRRADSFVSLSRWRSGNAPSANSSTERRTMRARRAADRPLLRNLVAVDDRLRLQHLLPPLALPRTNLPTNNSQRGGSSSSSTLPLYRFTRRCTLPHRRRQHHRRRLHNPHTLRSNMLLLHRDMQTQRWRGRLHRQMSMTI